MPTLELLPDPPEFASRAFVLGHLRLLLGHNAPADLAEPLLDFLIAIGVIVAEGDRHFLPHDRDALRRGAHELQAAMVARAETTGGPGILRHVAIGDGMAGHFDPDYQDRVLLASTIDRERGRHIESLRPMSECHTTMLIDFVLARLRGRGISASGVSRSRFDTMVFQQDESRQRGAAEAKAIQHMNDRIDLAQAPLRLLTEIRDRLPPTQTNEQTTGAIPSNDFRRTQMSDDDRAILTQHVLAAQADNPHAFLARMHEDGVALGRISTRLDDDGRNLLASMMRYWNRWTTEGGPHPDTTPRRPTNGDHFDFMKWREDRSGHSELQDWNHPTIKNLRGRWIAALERFLNLPVASQPATSTSNAQNGADKDALAEIEAHRLKRKRERMKNVGADLTAMFSVWEETTDLLMRTNLGEDSRPEELWFLRTLTAELSTAAHQQRMPRAALQALSARLRMLMPLEWFHDNVTKTLVLDEICRANVEVEELRLAYAKHPRADAEATNDASSSTDTPARVERTPTVAATVQRSVELERQKAVPAQERDAAAVLRATNWDREGRQWTLPELARELGCDRTQLTGRNSPSGPPRCRLFHAYWTTKQAEKKQRKVNLKQTNRTRPSDETEDGDE